MLFAPSTYSHLEYVLINTQHHLYLIWMITPTRTGARGIYHHLDKYGCIWEDERIDTTIPGYTFQSMTCIKDINVTSSIRHKTIRRTASMIVTARQLALSEDYSEADLDTQAYQMLAGPSLTDITTNFGAYNRLP